MGMPGSLPNNNENSATRQHHGQELSWSLPSCDFSLSDGKLSLNSGEFAPIGRHEQEIIEVREQNGNQEKNIEIVNQHLGNPSGNNKRRRKESKVWEEMTKYEGKDGMVWAKCKHCKKEFDGSSKKGTTHLKNHLERCPVKRKNGDGDANKSMKATVDLTSPVVSKEESVMDLIENFLMNGDSSALNSRKIEILQVYDEEKEKLRQFLDNLSCRFSLRIECYLNFFVLTVHYIDDSWEPRWKIISCLKFPKFPGTTFHYGNLVAILKESCLDMKIDGNICSIFYDFPYKDEECDANYDDAIGEINSWLSQRTSLPFGGSLIANHHYYGSLFYDSEDWDSFFGLSRCIDYVKSTASNKRKFEIAVDKVNSMGKKVTTFHVLPWIYDFESFGIAVAYKEVFCELELIDPDFKSINLTKEQWDDATITYEYFNELKCSVLSLCDSEYTTPNMYFPKFCDVYIKLLRRRTSEGYHLGKKSLTLIEKLASKQQKFFDRYWSKCNLVLVITAILDPRFKMEIVQLWYKKIYGIDADSYLKKINDDFISVYNEYARCGSANGDYTSSVSYLDAMGRPRTSSEGVSSKSELDRYLKDDPKCPPYEKLDILAWWRINTEIYPTLARMARDFLAMPIHFPLENIENICYPHLDDDIRSAVVCLTNWY